MNKEIKQQIDNVETNNCTCGSSEPCSSHALADALREEVQTIEILDELGIT